MEATHAFMKGVRGNGIFYRLEDFLVFFTIVSVTARKMGLKVLGFCPMFNHIHFLIKGISLRLLRSFIQRVAFLFVNEYNQDYGRTGPLFNSPFGKSIKKGVKIIMGCVAYVFNNPLAGKMNQTAIDYRWNLLAYFDNPHPFSSKLKKDHCRNVMRDALRQADYFFSHGKYLSYNALRSIFRCLDNEESCQMIDYIINKYNFLAFGDLVELYGSFEKMVTALESNAGSEFELEDEFGDHSCYREMLTVVKTLGYKGRLLNFENLSPEARDSLFWIIKNQTCFKTASINIFLHINR